MGDRGKAASLLRLLASNFTVPPFDIISEYSREQGYHYGVYVTNVGSFVAALFSMAGLAFGGGAAGTGAARGVAAFPEGWNRLRIGRVYIGGEAYALDAEHGQRATLTPLKVH
eukprot:261999-Prymnesium_polylepis.3